MNIEASDTEEKDENSTVSRHLSTPKQDLTDSPWDEERMKSEEVILDLPDVEDIPGQEHVHVAPLGELADVTISSDDEEGVGLFGDEDEDEESDIIMGTKADVTKEERSDLETTDKDMPTEDDNRLRESGLDDEDLEGEPLNEGSLSTDVSGGDLDAANSEDDDYDEEIGEEDEENNTYSLGGDDND